MATHSASSFHQAIAIQHRMNGAFGWDLDAAGESADETLADFASTPAAVLAFHVEDKILHLKRELMSITVGTPASIPQPLEAAFLIAIENLVTGLASNSKFPAKFRHRLPRLPASPQIYFLFPSPKPPPTQH